MCARPMMPTLAELIAEFGPGPGKSNEGRRRRVECWWQQGGLCWWCHKPTVLMKTMKPYGRLPANAATLDHLYSKWNPLRKTKPQHGERRLVMACHACNNNRGRDEQLSRPIELRQQESNRFPENEGT